jgi:glucokinase-like ROK family protein
MFSVTEKATQKRAKLHNKRLVLRVIYDQGPMSRADIARATHLARTTVSNVVSLLITEGLIEEVGQQALERGKPATLIHVVNDARHLIGIDLGGRSLSGTISNLRGEIIHRKSISLAGLRGEAALQKIYQLIDALKAETNRPLLGIGIGVPGLVDAKRGCVRQSARLDWWDFPLRQRVEQHYNLPVSIANDSHVAAFGEYTFGNGRDVSNLIVITVGMGVSAGVVLNGRLYFGDSFGAGEIGHVTVVRGAEAKACPCGNRGCLETVVSERALIAQAQAIARSDPNSPLHQFISSNDALIDIDSVQKAIAAGDVTLLHTVRQMGKRLGYAIATTAGILNIERVIISGSMAILGEPLLRSMREELNQCLHPMLASQTHIQLSHLGQDIVMKGAIAMVLAAEMELV